MTVLRQKIYHMKDMRSSAFFPSYAIVPSHKVPLLMLSFQVKTVLDQGRYEKFGHALKLYKEVNLI